MSRIVQRLQGSEGDILWQCRSPCGYAKLEKRDEDTIYARGVWIKGSPRTHAVCVRCQHEVRIAFDMEFPSKVAERPTTNTVARQLSMEQAARDIEDAELPQAELPDTDLSEDGAVFVDELPGETDNA